MSAPIVSTTELEEVLSLVNLAHERVGEHCGPELSAAYDALSVTERLLSDLIERVRGGEEEECGRCPDEAA